MFKNIIFSKLVQKGQNICDQNIYVKRFFIKHEKNKENRGEVYTLNIASILECRELRFALIFAKCYPRKELKTNVKQDHTWLRKINCPSNEGY